MLCWGWYSQSQAEWSPIILPITYKTYYVSYGHQEMRLVVGNLRNAAVGTVKNSLSQFSITCYGITAELAWLTIGY